MSSVVFSSIRVETEEAFLNGLNEFSPDLILSDYKLPSFDGTSALKIARKKCPDIPFIFVSGTMGEELAVETLKNGATDYVLKDKLLRLVPGVKRALKDAAANIEHKHAIKALKERELELLEAQKLAKTGNWTYDPVSQHFSWSEGMFNIWHLDPRLGVPKYSELLKHINSDDRQRCEYALKNAIEFGEAYELEFHICLPDGTEKRVITICRPECNDDGKVIQLRGTNQDITDYHNLKTQLMQAQKMEAVGQLAGGIAHDFNNILSAIVNYAYMLELHAKENEYLKNGVKQIINLSMKASQITQGLLTFSKKSIRIPEPLNLNDSVNSMVKLLSKFIGEDITINIKLSDLDPVIMADSSQIEQIIMNLATNARDAMHEGGTLTIATDIAAIDKSFIKSQECENSEKYAILNVTDTGTGMDKKTQQKIFEPFFTTKEVGKGTGLGLAIIYGIVSQHNGFIDVRSEPGFGTTFKIYFRTIKAAVSEKEEIKEWAMPGKGETILLAEDEENVRNSLVIILKKAGYSVIEAVNGEEAIKKFRENKDNISLLILDAVMPKKSGVEVYKTIKEIAPGIKAIFISGYSYELINKKFNGEEDLTVLAKPVLPQKLLTAIREKLQGAVSGLRTSKI